MLLVDNLDSFTFNVADLIHRVLGAAPVVWRHDHPADEEDLARFAAIVVGPGPGRPGVAADMGLSDLALRQTAVPVLGVCLGHQGLAHLHGGGVRQMVVPRHGIVSEVAHDGRGIFEGVPSPVRVVRYHSLEVADPVPAGLRLTARALDDGCVMALEDMTAPRWAVQFHPESVLSEHGERMLANFFGMAGVPTAGDEGAGGAVGVGDTLVARRQAPGPRRAHLGVRRIVGGCSGDAWDLRERLVGASPTSVWLDSSDGSGWSLVVDSAGPLAHELTHRVGQGRPLLDRLDEELDGWELLDAADLPFPWRPGWVGWWGYELKAETGGSAQHRSPWPDAWLTFADRGVVLDHASGDVWALWLEPEGDEALLAQQRRWADGVAEVVARGVPGPGHRASGARPAPARSMSHGQAVAHPRDDETSYLEKVRACQEEIARGESYEICLTTTWSARGTGVGEAELYRAMREVSPVPHGAWLRTPGVSVLGCSPERFVSVDARGRVESRPIKGTRPRGATPQEDAALAADLATAVKDRAENLMIVDLLRNDLHRVCRSGSVHVPELFAVESYATVHQLVSTVRGQLVAGMRPTDVLRACFPGGSMTGAPKVRTMEILDRLEGAARGIYSGAVGWIGLDGSMDTSIVIRTATWSPAEDGGTGGEVTFGVGGAVTALSDPAEEHAEMLAKAGSVLRALSLAGPGPRAAE
ncbi:aminodeoxychorismate synthase component I [Ornithinimicrobium avium]|uniref:aminodeoxychorismate synthase n=1 Tax=Ornithinimicrobium avium TaxID=2283195 RepID=A0A345NSK7_9MICO|nr:aminodeoxychorismate synthase component I [Ornithinimicrobium avium]